MTRTCTFTLRLAVLLAVTLAAAPRTVWADRIEAARAPVAPQLIIAVSVDQFSAGLFEHYRSGWTGGLRRLADQGVVFPNGYQSHAATETCPGHSTLLTGRHPSATGIVANNWLDRASGRPVYCVLDPAHPVPGRPDRPRGPANLKVSTFGEWLKLADPRSRVFGVSGKDRAAITMTGHQPDGVFWWDDERGFTTSVPAGTDEAQRLAPVAEFNHRLFARWLTHAPEWKPANPSCLTRQISLRYGDLLLDHRLPPPGGRAAPGETFTLENAPPLQQWFRASPGLDAVTLQLAESLIKRYHLGQGDAPDLLTISLSATDYIGHRYGNQGPEMCDQMAHLDALLGAFLDHIAALKVSTVLVLSADHGSVDAAERLARDAIPAVRIDTNRLVDETNRELRARLSLQFDALAGDGQHLYVSPKAGDDVARQRIAEAAAAVLRQRPEVRMVFTRDQIARSQPRPGTPVDELSLAERFAESYDPQRSADLFVALLPYASTGVPARPGDAIAGHGSLWNYDRRVPIVFWWPGAQGFEQSLPVETVDIAPTLAKLSRIKTPELDGRCLNLDGERGDSCAASPP
jgi:predicted AlkP superfamily pyrophosphatase or phosphodiesterase